MLWEDGVYWSQANVSVGEDTVKKQTTKKQLNYYFNTTQHCL